MYKFDTAIAAQIVFALYIAFHVNHGLIWIAFAVFSIIRILSLMEEKQLAGLNFRTENEHADPVNTTPAPRRSSRTRKPRKLD